MYGFLDCVDKNSIGKLAMLLAMSDELEEAKMIEAIKDLSSELKAGVSFIGGAAEDVGKKVTQAVVSCAKRNGFLEEQHSIHGILHATVEAFGRFAHEGLLLGHLKVKIALVANNNWVAVAVYGHSSLNKIINHEKVSLSIFHF